MLLHARAVDDPDWQKARAMVEQELGPAKVPTQTKLTVVLDKSAPWRSRWEQGERLTGVPELDDILLAYDIQIESGLFPDSGYYHVIVPREVNAYALENHLAKASRSLGLISGWDLYAWGNSFQFGYGSAVRPQSRLGGWSLGYYVGRGDCLAGCIYGRAFTFSVADDGATFLSSVRGDPLPDSLYSQR